MVVERALVGQAARLPEETEITLLQWEGGRGVGRCRQGVLPPQSPRFPPAPLLFILSVLIVGEQSDLL